MDGMTSDSSSESGSGGYRAGKAGRGAGVRGWSLALSLFLVCSSYVLFLCTYEPRFGTNDDQGMMSLASGLIDGHPSSRLVFTHQSIGFVLKTLYSWKPGVPWYACYLYAFQAIAWTLILHAFLTLRTTCVAAALFCAAVVFYGQQLAMQLQFTSTSILLGSAAIVYFLVVGQTAASWRVPLFTGLLLGLSALIRSTSLYACLLFWGPLFAVLALRIPVRRTAVFAAATAAVILGAAAAADFGDSPSARRWREFDEFNVVRGLLHGNNRPPRPALAEIRWSENDYFMFRGWFYPDREIYTTENLRFLCNKVSNTRSMTRFTWPLIARHAEMNRVPLGSVAVLLVVFLLWADRRRALALAAAAFWCVAVVAAAFYQHGRMPPHVSVPLLFSLALALVVVAGSPKLSMRSRGARPWVALAVTVLAVLLGINRAIPEIKAWSWQSDMNRADYAGLVRDFEELQAFDPEGIFVHWPNSLALGRISPLLETSQLPPIRLVQLGWLINSPPWLDQLEQLGIEDLYRAVALREHVYLVCSWRCSRRNVLSYVEFMTEHRGMRLRMEPTCVDEPCKVWLWTSSLITAGRAAPRHSAKK
jgi:hypothetical protein